MPDFESSPTGPPAVVNNPLNHLAPRTVPGEDAEIAWAMVVPKMYQPLPRARKVAQIPAAPSRTPVPVRRQIQDTPLEAPTKKPSRKPQCFWMCGSALAAAVAAFLLASHAPEPRELEPARLPLPKPVLARLDAHAAPPASLPAIAPIPPVASRKVSASRLPPAPSRRPKRGPAAQAITPASGPAEEAPVRMPQRPAVIWTDSEVVQPVAYEGARLIRKVKPIYPEMARITQVQGTIRFRATIGRDGAVDDLQVVSGPPLLIQAAREAVQQWRFLPATRNGDAIEDITQIDVSFALAK